MGMVHEKPRVVRRHDLSDGVKPTRHATLEPSTVIEIRDPAHPRNDDNNDNDNDDDKSQTHHAA
jgi:hypothetical protein